MRIGSAIKLIPFALILLLSGVGVLTGAEGPRAQFLGNFVWGMDKPWFGGWSGVELSPDGARMTVISDRSHILAARISRKGDQVTSIEPGRAHRLKGSTGKYLRGRVGDAEGLAVAPDGRIYIAFEGVTRVAEYTTPFSAAIVLHRPEVFRDFAGNRALEALAINDKGQLFTIPEVTEDDNMIPVYVFKNDTWSTAFTLTGGGGFLPVGADFGPDGRFYLLERGWNVFGFRTRLRRWALVNEQPQNEELLIKTRTGTHDNLEGLSVWRDTQARTRITMIADDNFLFAQRTELVEYAITE